MEHVVAQPASIACTVSRDGRSAVITLAGELDLSNVDVVRSHLAEAIESETERLVFDLSLLQFMDSSGLTLLLAAKQGAPRVELRSPPAAVRRLIEITGLQEALPTVE